MGSPPQMETMGAPHSSTAARHCSTVSLSLIVDLYSRIRPQPVQVRLHASKASSIITSRNFSLPPSRLPPIYFARSTVIRSGNLIKVFLPRGSCLERRGSALFVQTQKKQ